MNMARIWNRYKQTNTSLGKKVFIGMSGGVDSSVSAVLLKKQGYDVTGVFIKVWQPEWLANTSVCTWREDRLDAMRVAAKIDIPFITLDLEREYKKEVVDHMISEYRVGRTPNPDVMCNAYVKFGGFFDWAMKQGADFVATGHYAQIVNIKSNGAELTSEGTLGAAKAARGSAPSADGDACPEEVNSAPLLAMGIDSNKDQSYFLWTLKREQLLHILFPVGNISKPEVRKLAKKFGLPNAEKKDSQGLCFIGKIDVKEFLSHYMPAKKGNVLDVKGNIIGEHDGSFFFTIGERHGFTITKKTPNDEPYYIISKDIRENTITVSNKSKQGHLPDGQREVKLKDVNWISGKPPKVGRILQARSRYREPLQKIKIIDEVIKTVVTVHNHELTIQFERPQYTLSSGQSLVIYDGDICWGGGVIVI
ncbi:MAG TPA: tRNA 2-thiouridine(34) synthase MnmA [Candidatus Paceibacterota bacterium]